LRSFLLDGEAESYAGLTVEFIRGKKAFLTIYDDGNITEKVYLKNYTVKEDLHQLMREKGFKLLDPKDRPKVNRTIVKEEKKWDEEGEPHQHLKKKPM